MNLKPYPEYKDSDVPWLGDVPRHWEIRRIRNVTNLIVSNVDKHSFENENIVCLCNYTDVYKNEKITNKIKFMKATASEEEINKFKLRINDVIITKDSESWNDIGVPALVLYENQDFICGYHLAILRPQEQLSGQYLFRLLQDKNISAQFHIIANGVTRYGMSQNSIKDVKVLLPFLSEQTTIARFLDYKTAQIARFIKAKKRMIELLKEQKQVIINDAVTGKIVIKDEGGRLKAEKRPDSSFIPHPSSFLQTVPEGWEVKRIKSISHIRYGLGQPPKEKEDGLPLIRATNVDHGKIVVKDLLRIDINDVPASRDAVLREGEIIVVRSGAYTADSAIIPKEFTGSVAGYDMVMTVFKAMPEYVALALLSKYLRDDQLIQASMRAAQPHLNKEELGSSFIILPQNQEQETIVLVTEKKLNALDFTISRTEREISLMQEYRTRLVSDVVTGKIDVRDIEIPDIADIDDTIDESIDEPEGEEELETAEAEE